MLKREIRLGRCSSMTEKMLNGMGWKTALNINPKTFASDVKTGLVKHQQGNAVLKSCNAFWILAVQKISLLH